MFTQFGIMTVPSIPVCYGYHIAGLVDDLELEMLLDRADWHCIHIVERSSNINSVCGYMRFDDIVPVNALEYVHPCIRFTGSRIVIADLVQVLVQCYNRVDCRGIFKPVGDDGRSVGSRSSTALRDDSNLGMFPTHPSPGHLSVGRDLALQRLQLERARAPSPVSSMFNFGGSDENSDAIVNHLLGRSRNENESEESTIATNDENQTQAN
jgi:hypothetical protein